jgi:hypothetical protein
LQTCISKEYSSNSVKAQAFLAETYAKLKFTPVSIGFWAQKNLTDGALEV